MFWFLYFWGSKTSVREFWSLSKQRYSLERQKLFWVHLVRSHYLWRAKLMSLGRQDSVPTPFIDFLFPSGKSLSTFVTQFPRCQMRKHLLSTQGGMELQKCRALSPAGATRVPPCSQRTFCCHGLLSEILPLWNQKVWWRSDFVVLWWQICQRFCFETLQDCISALKCLIYLSAVPVRAVLILSEPSPSAF